MSQATRTSCHDASEREALGRRIRHWYDWFNQGLWEKCFALIDPKLRDQSKVQLSVYSERLFAFKGLTRRQMLQAGHA